MKKTVNVGAPNKAPAATAVSKYTYKINNVHDQQRFLTASSAL
jgi:hypothetical protein